MAQHLRNQGDVVEVVPWTVKYQYPNMANKAVKTIVKIPPIGGSEYGVNNKQFIINFPAQGYLDCANSFLSFDVSIVGQTGTSNLRFQNNIQSIFERVRAEYGSLVTEDLKEYAINNRIISEAVATNQSAGMDQTSIGEGIGGLTLATATSGQGPYTYATGFANARNHSIQSYEDTVANHLPTSTLPTNSVTSTVGPVKTITRRYTVQPILGLMLAKKMLPLKWMASQFRLNFTLNDAIKCMAATVSGTNPTFTVSNIRYLAVLYEFDDAFDAAFLKGLQAGVPIKFGTWNHYPVSPANSTKQVLNIPERNRSIKSAFTVQVPQAEFVSGGEAMDSHAFLQSSGTTGNDYLESFQWRIGGKYYPAQPVECKLPGGGSNGAAEAYNELEKALKIVGDYKLSTGINVDRWCLNINGSIINNKWDWASFDVVSSANLNKTMKGPSCFIIGTDFETSNGLEISGINGEEQNDLALIIDYNSNQQTSHMYHTFVYYDSLMIIRENNYVEIRK